MLARILSSAQADGLVDKDVAPTLRDGRLVIPVAPAMKRRLKGIIHDESATGKTVFIEPAEVVEANNRIRELEGEEKREVIRILREFTSLLTPNIREFQRVAGFLADVEFCRSKALLADHLEAVSPQIQDAPLIDWTLAKHPLLELTLRKQGKHVVPMDIALSRQQRILIISESQRRRQERVPQDGGTATVYASVRTACHHGRELQVRCVPPYTDRYRR